MERYIIYISCTVSCIQMFPLVAKLQEGAYHKLIKGKMCFKVEIHYSHENYTL